MSPCNRRIRLTTSKAGQFEGVADSGGPMFSMADGSTGDGAGGEDDDGGQHSYGGRGSDLPGSGGPTVVDSKAKAAVTVPTM